MKTKSADALIKQFVCWAHGEIRLTPDFPTTPASV